MGTFEGGKKKLLKKSISLFCLFGATGDILGAESLVIFPVGFLTLSGAVANSLAGGAVLELDSFRTQSLLSDESPDDVLAAGNVGSLPGPRPDDLGHVASLAVLLPVVVETDHSAQIHVVSARFHLG